MRRRGGLIMYEPHHGPMSNNWVLVSFLGIIIALSIWKLTPAWGFLIILFSVIIFLSSYISAIRAPLMSDEEIELAVHEKYHGRRYPDTDLHHGHISKSKKFVHSRHKKKLVQLHLEELLGKRKPAKKPVVAKKVLVKKVVAARKTNKSVQKKAASKPIKKVAKKKTRRQ